MNQDIERIEAKVLYDAFKQNNEKQYLKRLEISGIVLMLVLMFMHYSL